MPLHYQHRSMLRAVLLVISVAGCTPEAQRYIRFPNLFHPGPAGYQRAEAVEHDPYPQGDVGPEVVGGRPLGYLQPVNEVDRARMAAPRPPVLQPIPVPSWPVTQPVVTTPYPAAPPPQATPYQFQQRSPY